MLTGKNFATGAEEIDLRWFELKRTDYGKALRPSEYGINLNYDEFNSLLDMTDTINQMFSDHPRVSEAKPRKIEFAKDSQKAPTDHPKAVTKFKWDI